ncbi:MAG: OmpA family protein, partial [Bacteroidota bacterium]
MKTYRLNFLVLACFMINNAISQELELTSKDSIVANSWIVGLGYNIVDDSGDVFDNLFSVEDQWNAVPYPSRISIGRYFKNGIGIEAIGTYNTYKEGKIIDGTVNAEETNYFGLDTRLSYDLNKIIGETAWFDPYIGVGLGYTDANNQGRGTYNAVIGSRFWFSDKFGLDFSSSGKWSIGDNATNHIQHAAGVVYRFGIEKELSKKGLEKLAVINALEKENQSVKDSISRANRAAEEVKVLADKLAKEKEDTLLAEENARKKAKENYQRNIENAVKELGYVYFDLNSSYLSREYKGLLDKLA